MRYNHPPISTVRRHGRYCETVEPSILAGLKLMNGPSGQWAKGDPRLNRGPVPPNGFLPPRQLKPAPYKRDTRSEAISIALAHGDDYDQNRCRVLSVLISHLNQINHNVRVFSYVVVECDCEGSVRDGPRGVPRRAADRPCVATHPGGTSITPRSMGHPVPRMHALPQGRSSSLPPRSHTEIRLVDVDASWLATDRRPQRLQDDQGHVPQGGIHRQTQNRIHEYTGRLR